MHYNSFLAEVLGSRYKEVRGYEVIDFIKKELKSHGSELRPNQEEALRNGWSGEHGRLPFQAFMYCGKKDNKLSVLWRLTIIPLGLWIVLLYLSIPFKWILTGKPYYDSDPDKDEKFTIGSFTAKWVDKVRQ